MNHYDRQAILYGAVCGLFFALPAAVLQRTLLDDAPWSGLMLVVVVFAAALAGYAAARAVPPNPLKHGALAGAITFLGPQIVYVIAAREVPNPIAIVFGILLFASLGTIGAYVAVWKGASTAPTERGR
ncbi:MAG TPA: TIGR04086 family membrane protein [Acidimicrobiales bacterium]